MIEELSLRYTAALGGPGATTLTFDAGQNFEPNFTRLGALGLHFAGSDHRVTIPVCSPAPPRTATSCPPMPRRS